MKHSKADVELYLQETRHYLPLYTGGEKQRVYQIVRKVAPSGMSRVISTYVIHQGDLVCLDYRVHVLTGLPLAKDQGVRIGGCGMDMGFALLDRLVSKLYPDVTPERATANDYRRTWL